MVRRADDAKDNGHRNEDVLLAPYQQTASAPADAEGELSTDRVM
jgi:hypothetical protein